jgi:hypothetical protein
VQGVQRAIGNREHIESDTFGDKAVAVRQNRQPTVPVIGFLKAADQVAPVEVLHRRVNLSRRDAAGVARHGDIRTAPGLAPLAALSTHTGWRMRTDGRSIAAGRAHQGRELHG